MPCFLDDEPERPVARSAGVDDDAETNSGLVFVRSFQQTHAEKKRVSWLGVGVAEASGDVGEQLGLKPGQGLVVTMLVNNSPADKAALHRHDVLAQFDDQMLMDAEQLRKLVQMHAEGDTVNLVIYRGGKKETISAKLGHASFENSANDDEMNLMRGVSLKLASLNNLGPDIADGVRQAAKAIEDEKAQINSLEREMTERNRHEIERAIEQTRRALEQAVREHQLSARDFDAAAQDMEQVAKGGVDVDNDATVVVQKDLKSTRTIVESDDTGDYVIVADPKRHLTAHNHTGKVLFDGEIETPTEQAKVPKAVWEKVKPMLAQLGLVKADGPSQPAMLVRPDSP
jgi:hypothetical protein